MGRLGFLFSQHQLFFIIDPDSGPFGYQGAFGRNDRIIRYYDISGNDSMGIDGHFVSNNRAKTIIAAQSKVVIDLTIFSNFYSASNN